LGDRSPAALPLTGTLSLFKNTAHQKKLTARFSAVTIFTEHEVYMPLITIEQATDYILAFAHEHQDFISNMKLQKLLYYAQAWHLALKNQPLFEAEFEAWIHGPVHPATYQRFKAYTFNNIDLAVEKPNLPPEAETFLLEVLEEYFPLTAYALERLTHQEQPWLEARGNLAPTASTSAVIPAATMANYYSKQARV
jgi:uncharacterized phage-associated protein